jgi:hypothetical protein
MSGPVDPSGVAQARAFRLELRTAIPRSRRFFGVVFGVLAIVGYSQNRGSDGAHFPFLLMGAIGLAMVFVTRGVVVDTEARTVTSLLGIGPAVWRMRRPLGHPTHVSVDREVRGKKNRSIVYAVRLVGDGARELLAPASPDEGRILGERVAKHLAIPMHDSSSGVLVVREPGTFDLALRDRLYREQGGVAAPNGPAPGRLSAVEDGAQTTCILPPAGLRAPEIIQIAVGGLLLAFYVYSASPLSVPLAFLLLPSAAALLKLAVGRSRVTFSQEGVTLRPGLFGRVAHIGAHELEELQMVESRGEIQARSDRTTLVLGRHLRVDELTWLHASICHRLCPPAPPYRDRRAATG